MSWLKGISKDDWLTWSAWQFPLLWFVGLGRTLAVMAACALLGTLGGWAYGHKAFRWAGVPLVVCAAIFFFKPSGGWIFAAMPFMIKLAPSYGVVSPLRQFVAKRLAAPDDAHAVEAVTRLVCFLWYWSAILLANAL